MVRYPLVIVKFKCYQLNVGFWLIDWFCKQELQGYCDKKYYVVSLMFGFSCLFILRVLRAFPADEKKQGYVECLSGISASLRTPQPLSFQYVLKDTPAFSWPDSFQVFLWGPNQTQLLLVECLFLENNLILNVTL
jgi:hypothetical protein